MDPYIIDWRLPDKSISTGKMQLVDSINPLKVRTKDGFYLEIDARMITQLDDYSYIVARFGSIPMFVEDVVNPLINSFLTNKEKAYIFLNRLKLQEELTNELQIKLTVYHVKIRSFIMVYYKALC